MKAHEFEELYTEFVEFAISDCYKPELEAAKRFFINEKDESDITGFTEWFVFNHPLNSTGVTILDEFYKSNPSEDVKLATESFRSIFEISTEREKFFLTDLITGDHYELVEPIQHSEGLYSLRVIPVNDLYRVVGDIYEFDILYKDSLKKYFLDQYNQLTSIGNPMDLKIFVQEQNHLIYKLLGITDGVYEENITDESLLLYQTTYAYKMSGDALVDLLLSLEVPVYPDEEDLGIYRVMLEDEILAEIEIFDQKLNVLCNNESHLRLIIEMFKSILSDSFIFVSSNTYTLEELLEE
ncbi:MAG: hypothetical protein IBX70_03120 [Clostridia bacterium]|nr:hypothetical protein [Clostridia bacterium]